MKSYELRDLRNKFRQSKWHIYLPEANIITPSQDNTSLFNNSGMQQLVPYLVGKPHSFGKRLVNVQKCIRTNDIDEVGDRSHLSYFEMMGAWSLGDYFKKDALMRTWEFLTNSKWLGIDPRMLAITVFEWNEEAPKDEESANIWKEIWINEDKISYMIAEDNRRKPGPIWPCGACSEFYYRVGNRRWGPEFPPEYSNVRDDENNWMEIGNDVFMEYYKDEDAILSKLKQQNVDMWRGLDRFCLLLQKKDTIYETDLFEDILATVEKYSWLKYEWNEIRMRIIVDHMRTSCMIIQDGGIASNTGAWYILRMLIRRMYYNLILLKDLNEKEFDTFLDEIISVIAKLNPHRNFNIKKLILDINDEVSGFRKTISKWLKILLKYLESKNNALDWEMAFTLYDTYGFPIELTKEICESKNCKIDLKWFELEMKKAKNKSREASKNFFDKWIDWSKYLNGVPETKFLDVLESCKPKLIKDFVVNGCIFALCEIVKWWRSKS